MVAATYFDGRYARKALVMFRSLRKHVPNAQVHALCWDGDAFDVAHKAGMHPLHVEAFLASHPELGLDRLPGPPRSRAEHMWTVGSRWVEAVMRMTSQPVTYIDADIWFHSSPAPMFEQLGNARVGVVPHNFCASWPTVKMGNGSTGILGTVPTIATHAQFGLYNCGVVAFNDIAVAEDWASECRQWCFAHVEVPLPDRRGRYGDQKYMDEWPEKWGAKVLAPEVCAGPWGVWAAPWDVVDGVLCYGGRPLVAFHYSSFEWGPHGQMQYTRPEYCLSEQHRELIYQPYIKAMQEG